MRRDRPYSDPNKPGRIDSNGEEWWACDPYPTWFRWEGGLLFIREPFEEDNPYEAGKPMVQADIDMLFNADPNCNHIYDSRYSGIGCANCGGWFCY